MRFHSTILEADGSLITAVLRAEDEDELARSLEGGGRVLVKSRPVRALSPAKAKAIPDAKLLTFTKSMAALLQGGVPVLSSFDSIRAEEDDPQVCEIYTGVMERVEGGSGLADALAAYPRSFSRLYVELVRAGEMTGAIDTSFTDIGMFLTWQKNIKGLIKQATIYPAVLLCATWGLIMAMLGFTIPRLGSMLSNIAPDEMPTSTKVLMGMSDVVSNNLLLTIGGSIGTGIAAALFLRSRPGSQMLSTVLVRMPVAKGVVEALNRGRLCHTLSMLMGAGVAPMRALEMAAATMSLPKLAEGLRYTSTRLIEGDKLSDAFRRAQVLPGLHLVMIKTGEESGNLAAAFKHVGEVYDEQSEEAVKRTIAILEPLMTCVLATIVVIVAGVVLNTLYGAMAGMSQ